MHEVRSSFWAMEPRPPDLVHLDVTEPSWRSDVSPGAGWAAGLTCLLFVAVTVRTVSVWNCYWDITSSETPLHPVIGG